MQSIAIEVHVSAATQGEKDAVNLFPPFALVLTSYGKKFDMEALKKHFCSTYGVAKSRWNIKLCSPEVSAAKVGGVGGAPSSLLCPYAVWEYAAEGEVAFKGMGPH